MAVFKTVAVKTKTDKVVMKDVNYFSFEKQFFIVRAGKVRKYIPTKDILEIAAEEE